MLKTVPVRSSKGRRRLLLRRPRLALLISLGLLPLNPLTVHLGLNLLQGAPLDAWGIARQLVKGVN